MLDIKKYRPLLLGALLYTLLGLLYFAPQLSGKVLSMSDITQYEGMSRESSNYRALTGEDPQWTGAMFAGMPTYLIDISYPAQIIKRGTMALLSVISEPAVFIIFAMAAMALMLVMMGVNSYVAIVGGAMYGLSTYFFIIIGVGHLTKMWALAFAPLLFGGTYITLRGDMWRGAALTALFAALQIGANHPQITYYFLMAMATFWLSEAIYSYREGALRSFAKRTALLIVAGLLGVMSNFAPLWYTMQHTGDTVRGGSELIDDQSHGAGGLELDYATAWSYGKVESLNMLIPDMMGRSSMHTFAADGAVAESLAPYNLAQVATQLPTYWGDQPFTAGPTYLGAVVVLLAALGLCLTTRRERCWIVTISVVMLMLGWGSNLMWFTELGFKILPGYDKFRTVSMTLVILEWSAPLLAAYALSKLWQGVERAKLITAMAWSMGIVGGTTLLLLLGGSSIFNFNQSAALKMLLDSGFPSDIATKVAAAMAVERGDMLGADAQRTLLLILATGATIALYAAGKIKRSWWLAAIGVLVIIDLVPVNKRFLNNDHFHSPYTVKLQPSAADKEIMKDKELAYRVLNLTVSPFNDATTSYFHRSVGGYHGAKLARYQDIIEHYLAKQDSGVLDMLNTKYLILPAADGTKQVQQRPTANGAAWMVESIVPAAGANEQIALLGQIDTKRQAVIGSDMHAAANEPLTVGTIKIEEYKPNYQRYTSSAEGASLAIFSEIYYPKGWSAYIDGEPVPYLRANYILRAMRLPAGEHTIEWRYRAPAWCVVEGVTLIASLIIILSIIVIFGKTKLTIIKKKI